MAEDTPNSEQAQGAPESVAAPEIARKLPQEYGEYDVDADVGNVPAILIWIFVLVVLWGIFAWIPFFGGVPGSAW